LWRVVSIVLPPRILEDDNLAPSTVVIGSDIVEMAARANIPQDFLFIVISITISCADY